jgi:hypothetical protein
MLQQIYLILFEHSLAHRQNKGKEQRQKSTLKKGQREKATFQH